MGLCFWFPSIVYDISHFTLIGPVRAGLGLKGFVEQGIQTLLFGVLLDGCIHFRPSNDILPFQGYVISISQHGNIDAILINTSGIPQGSVLGPVLFVVYINTMVKESGVCDVYLYADDTKIFNEIICQ